jgi:hypothetical protein
LQISCWLPNRKIVVVADSGFAAIELLAAVGKKVCVVTRLRLDAALYGDPPPKSNKRGRPALKGKPLPKLKTYLEDPNTVWQAMKADFWYGHKDMNLEFTTGTALWYRAGMPPVAIRWVLVRDPKGKLDPCAFLATDIHASPRDILAWFVSRWQVEVTFQEARAHLGVETQRQWSDKAILRTTPALLGLYAIIALWTHDIAPNGHRLNSDLKVRGAAWYNKAIPTFSDAIAAVRKQIWQHQISLRSSTKPKVVKIPQPIWERLKNAAAYAA